MNKILKYIWNNLEVVVMMVLLDAFMINVLLQIITRVVFNQPLTFTEEVSRYLFVWMVFLGLPFGVKYNKHIRMNIITDRLPYSTQYILNLFIDFITIAVFVWMLIYGIRYLGFCANTRTPVLQISKAIIASIIPICSFLMVVRSIEKIILDLKIFSAERKAINEEKMGGSL